MRASTLQAYQSQYLKVVDLQGRTARAQVSGWELVKFPKRENRREFDELLVLSFAGKQKKLVLSVGRCNSMVELFGDETDDWPGKFIRLSPGKASNGKPTILISDGGQESDPEPQPEPELDQATLPMPPVEADQESGELDAYFPRDDPGDVVAEEDFLDNVCRAIPYYRHPNHARNALRKIGERFQTGESDRLFRALDLYAKVRAAEKAEAVAA